MASGNTLLVLLPGCEIPPAANAADLVSIAGASTPAESILVLAFDDTTNEYADFRVRLPRHYAGGGLTCSITWGCASATTNSAVIGIAFRRIEDDVDDLDTTSHTYDFNDSASLTPPSVVGEIAYDTVTFTNGADMDSVAAGDYCIVRVRRNTSDSVVGDVYVHSIEIRET